MPTADNFIGDEPQDEPDPCPKCATVHYRAGRRTCTAHSKDGQGRPCMNYPHPGATVCYQHGGATPQVQGSAEWNRFNRDIRRKCAAALATFGDQYVPPNVDLIDPVAELLTLLWRKKMAERFWAERVAELEVPDVGDHIRVQIVGTGEEAEPMEVFGDAGAIVGPDRWGELRTHPYVKEWRTATNELAKISKMAIDAGIDERMTKLAEEQGALIESLLRRIVGALCSAPGVPLTDWAKSFALETIGHELRQLEPGR